MTRANLAVVARRSEPPDSLDYFPTPPWATRAFMTEVLVRRGLFVPGESVLEPACGEGHMAAVLTEFSDVVHAADIFPYGYGEVADFLDDGHKPCADWIITNPPFNKGLDFVRQALTHPAAKAAIGVALLLRLQWLEGAERARFFAEWPPHLVALFADRVSMRKGRWEPKDKGMTAHAWFVWLQPDSLRGRPRASDETRFVWISPGAQRRHHLLDDVKRFVPKTPAPLLEETR